MTSDLCPLHPSLCKGQEHVDERFIRNAAVLPDWRPFPPRPRCLQPFTPGPLLIHGRVPAEYQQLYHSVVDPMLQFSTGRPRPYSLQLGRRIKQRLWEALSRPVVTSTPLADGLQEIRESASEGVYAPLIDLDVSGEPRCQQPLCKRARR